MARYSFCFVPVEIGLDFLLQSRVEWIKNERKIDVKMENLQDLKFDSLPGEVVEKLNEQKKKMLDFLTIEIEMVLDEKLLFVQGQQDILGQMRHQIGTLASEPLDWKEFPPSLKTFQTAILVGDITQRDTRKNKNNYQLRTSSVGDEVLLQWVNSDDLIMVNQKKADLDLVRLVSSVEIADGAGQSIKNMEDNDAAKDPEENDDTGDDFTEAVEGNVENQ